MTCGETDGLRTGTGIRTKPDINVGITGEIQRQRYRSSGETSARGKTPAVAQSHLRVGMMPGPVMNYW